MLLLACGKSERDHADEGSAGMAPSSVAGTSSISSGGSAGTSATTGGASVASGGVSTTGGGAQAMGGMSVTLGGAMPEPGEAGAPAAGGAAACSGYLHACGCGCCGVQPSPAKCVYPDLGEDLSEVTAQDLATKMNSAGCANVGCSIGQDYFCCAAPPARNEGASYETSLLIGGIDRILLHKMATPNCGTLTLQQRYPADPEDPQAPPVELPAGWKLETVRTLPCSSSAIGPNAIGAIGSFELRVLNGSCVVDVHLTAFFTNDKRELSTERFDADGVPVGLSVAECK